MADISSELEQIMKARYGRDVRKSIHDGINALNGSAEAERQAAEEAQKAAETAKEAAETAQGKSEAASVKSEAAAEAAEEAKEAAETAKEAAETAQGKSEAASVKSEAAQEAAEEAQRASEAAQTAAETAQGKSEAASVKSETAQEAAEAAQEAAEAARTASETAQEGSEAGKTAAETAQEAAETAQTQAEFYAEQCRQITEGLAGAILPLGTITSSELLSFPVENVKSGYMYNISDEFVTTDKFREGAGSTIAAGSNVYMTAEGKWDVLAGSPVTGVKGDKETYYRRGNVNITAEDIGAVSLKKGGTVSNTFIVNKVSTSYPTGLNEIDIHADGKIGFLGTSGGVNDTLMHLDASSPSIMQITMKNAKRLITPPEMIGPASATLHITGSENGIHLEHAEHSRNPNVGLWVTETGVVINSEDGNLDYLEKGNLDFVGASFNQSNRKIDIYGPEIKVGPEGDFFIEAKRTGTSKELKLRGGANANITIRNNNDIEFGSDGGNLRIKDFSAAGAPDVLTIDRDGRIARGGADSSIVFSKDGFVDITTSAKGYNGNDEIFRIFNNTSGNPRKILSINGDEDLEINNYLFLGGNIIHKEGEMSIGVKEWGGSRYKYIEISPTTSSIDLLASAPSAHAKNIGNSSNKWTNIYATNGVIQTSDRNKKSSIEELTDEKAQQLIYGLKPSTYQMNSGTSGRTHWGMISQDIEELLEELNWTSLDFAGFIKSPKMHIEEEERDSKTGKVIKERVEEIIEGEYDYSLRYDELIAPMIKTIQAQHSEIETLKQEMTLLKQQMSDLLSREV